MVAAVAAALVILLLLSVAPALVVQFVLSGELVEHSLQLVQEMYNESIF
jgi:hypothetical protein